METIKNTLNDESSANYIPCKKFVCKTVNIYKDMYKRYCENASEGYKMDTDTCSQLNQFKFSYTHCLRNELHKKAEIPSLDDIQNKYFNECQKYEEGQGLQQIANDENSPTYSKTTLSQDKNQHAAAPIIPHEADNKGSLMSPTLSTALGTAAGTSSILALLYKFTSGRKWLRSGIGASGRKIHTNLYGKVPNELLFDGIEHNDLNSYRIGYETM